VIELLKADKPFTKENLEATYVRRRRASWVEKEGKVADRSVRFQKGVVTGMIGMARRHDGGLLNLSGSTRRPQERILPCQTLTGRINSRGIGALQKSADEGTFAA
jgi:electron-transferring-flavoprotein dehydrogenase